MIESSTSNVTRNDEFFLIGVVLHTLPMSWKNSFTSKLLLPSLWFPGTKIEE